MIVECKDNYFVLLFAANGIKNPLNLKAKGIVVLFLLKANLMN